MTTDSSLFDQCVINILLCACVKFSYSAISQTLKILVHQATAKLIFQVKIGIFFSVSQQNLPYFFGYKTGFFSFQNNPKVLDPSCKTDLELWHCLGRVELVL